MTLASWVAHVILDFSISPSPFGLDFGTLEFGLGLNNFKDAYHET